MFSAEVVIFWLMFPGIVIRSIALVLFGGN